MGQAPYLFKFFVFFVAMKTYPHLHSRVGHIDVMIEL